MVLGYFVDGPLYVDKNGKMYGVSYDDRLFSRYLKFSDTLHLCMRVKKIEDTSRLNEIRLPNVTLTACINLSSILFLYHISEAEKTIRKVLLECDIAVVRMQGAISLIAVKLCQEMDKPYVIEMVACVWDQLWNHSIKGKVAAYPMKKLVQKAVMQSTAVLYVTNEFLQKRYPTKGASIGCSDVELSKNCVSIIEKRLKKIESISNKFIIGTTAAVNVRYKGQQYIIKAIAKLKKEGITHFEYQIVGNGNQDFLKSIIKKYGVEKEVKLIGGMPHEQVFNWLDSIDIYTQPSRQEGLPRALIEAMSRGLPAFGARTGGIPELLHEEYIFSNTRHNIEEICQILKKYTIESMKKQAILNYEKAKDYDEELLSKKRESFYRKYLKM